VSTYQSATLTTATIICNRRSLMRDIAINSSSLPGYNKVSTGCGTGQ
jgi:hypothetical protein